MKLILFILLLLLCGIARGQSVTVDSIISRKGNSFLLHGKDERGREYVFARNVRGAWKAKNDYYLNRVFTYYENGIKQRGKRYFFILK